MGNYCLNPYWRTLVIKVKKKKMPSVPRTAENFAVPSILSCCDNTNYHLLEPSWCVGVFVTHSFRKQGVESSICFVSATAV